ncbi:MAG: EFR1 family ferrodoxin [Clostridia bacterium]|nr:EFR1 family ferrodoxin [Clostridia bacterium]
MTETELHKLKQQRVGIYYFSATENTAKVARLYRDALGGFFKSCELIRLPLAEDGAMSSSEYDLIGIGYPVHAFNAPELVLRFASSLPMQENGRRVFLFKTSGEPMILNRASSLKLKKILKRKHYIVTNEYSYCMPYNIIFKHTDGEAYRMWQTAQALVALDTREIAEGKPRREGKLFLGGLFAFIMRIEHFGARLNGRFFAVKGACTLCGRCVKNCPMGNISIKDGKIVFGKNCAMCMRCSFFCPKNCIKIGLFDKWRVNGEYSFAESYDMKSPHEKYCKRAYRRYFAEAKKRIEEGAKN